MKKTLLTIALVAMAAVSSFAQGTIAFGNSALTRVLVAETAGGATRNATTADSLTISVWFGPAGAAADALTKVDTSAATIGSTAGVMVNAPSVFAIPGTQPDQVVSLQIRASNSAGWSGSTKVAQVTLGQTAGPGAVIWQTASGVNESRFTPLVVTVPEPSTIALGVLGLGSLLLFRRRK